MATPPGQIEDDLRVAQRLTPLTAEEKKALLPRAGSWTRFAVRRWNMERRAQAPDRTAARPAAAERKCEAEKPSTETQSTSRSREC